MSRSRSNDAPPSDPTTPALEPSPEQLDQEADQETLGTVLFQPPTSPWDTSSLSTDPEWSPLPDEPQSPGPDVESDSAPLSTGSRLAGLRATFRGAVKTAGTMAHQLLTREGSLERELDLYVPDSEDVKAISAPLAGLASRRMPAGAQNPDVTDLVTLALALLGYGTKQKAKAAHISTMRGLDPGEPEGDVPAGYGFETASAS